MIGLQSLNLEQVPNIDVHQILDLLEWNPRLYIKVCCACMRSLPHTVSYPYPIIINKVFFCMTLKISENFGRLRLFFSEKSHIHPGMVLSYFHYFPAPHAQALGATTSLVLDTIGNKRQCLMKRVSKWEKTLCCCNKMLV